MPHKKNPISAENLCGLSRLLRAQCSAAVENIPLWHERDISHSSVERVILPDATTLVDYMVARTTRLVAGLGLRPARMAANLGARRRALRVGKVMLALVQAGLSRRAAYERVQGHALRQGQENAELVHLPSATGDPPFSPAWPPIPRSPLASRPRPSAPASICRITCATSTP